MENTPEYTPVISFYNGSPTPRQAVRSHDSPEISSIFKPTMEHPIFSLLSEQVSLLPTLFHWSAGEEPLWEPQHIHTPLRHGTERQTALRHNVQDVQVVVVRTPVFPMVKRPFSTTQVTHFGVEFPICRLVGQTVPTMEIATITNLEWVFGSSMFDRQHTLIFKAHVT